MDIGDQVPDFKATIQDGSTVSLGELVSDGPVVIFSYPKAHTGGCTAEACHFRDLSAEFADVGASRIGISRDEVADQASFVDENSLDFPLIADPDGEISGMLGAKRPGPVWNRRWTFVIDEDRTLLNIIKSESDMKQHADEALALLRDPSGTAA